MPSYYCPELNSSRTVVMLEGEEFHHLSHVKRIAVGDSVMLNSGTGYTATGKITDINKRTISLAIVDCDFTEALNPRYAIAFALLKNHHDELLVEKCTELGAAKFYPLITEYVVREGSQNTVQRLKRISLAAIKQCDNPYLPEVQDILDLAKALEQIISDGFQPVLCSERRPDLWMTDLDETIEPCFLIGPEGGWNDSEYELFAEMEVPEITISPLVLRAETAAIAAAAQFVVY